MFLLIKVLKAYVIKINYNLGDFVFFIDFSIFGDHGAILIFDARFIATLNIFPVGNLKRSDNSQLSIL